MFITRLLGYYGSPKACQDPKHEKSFNSDNPCYDTLSPKVSVYVVNICTLYIYIYRYSTEPKSIFLVKGPHKVYAEPLAVLQSFRFRVSGF